MSEGRRSQVVLLDERRLDIIIQPRLYAGELLDLVASQFQIKEKEFFGLSFLNDANQTSWLILEKRILEQDLPRKVHSQDYTLILHFRVKYFVESIEHLRDAATVEAFYLQIKSNLAKGEIEVDSETVFKLAALVIQATYSDYDDDLIFKTHLRRLSVLPASVIKEYPSINLCEENVLRHYKELIGTSRGDAILNYLKIVENLPTYGQHYYEIKDGKTSLPCWLGLSYKGISQYEKDNRCNPKKVFLWKQLENLYHRDKKFTIEVHEARRVVHTLSSFNLYEDAIEEPAEDYDDLSDAICDPTTQVSVSRRTLAPANVTVYVWYASSPLITKCIWSMAISQHLFFLDRKKNQSKSLPNLNQIASELCHSVQSLSSGGSLSNISRTNSSSSLPSTILGGEISEESKAAALEMLEALRTRKEALEAVLTKKTEELKTLCLQEGELTGEIPPEIPLQPGEAQPQVRRRVGTSFSLSDKLISKSRNNDRETLNDLELQYEIQSKIASAAFQLMSNCNSRKSVRKQRKLSYDQATLKLRAIERKLCILKREKKNDELKDKTQDKLEDESANQNAVDSSQISPESGAVKNSLSQTPSVASSMSLPQLIVTECNPVPEPLHDVRHRHQSLQQLPYTNKPRKEDMQFDIGRNIHSSCQRLEYDSISCGSTNGLPLRITYRNRFEPGLDIDGSNLYSVPNRRTSQVFDSQDDMLLNAKKSDLECRSTIIKSCDNKPVYSNTLPLSSSYDDRIWYDKSKENTHMSSDGSSLETSFEAHSNNSCETASLSCFSSESHKKNGSNSPNNLPKQMHFHSENALNRDVPSPVTFSAANIGSSTSNIVRPVRLKKMTHVHSVPHLFVEPISKSEQSKKNNLNFNASQRNINLVVDLVQASILLQNGKKTAENSTKYPLPKPKTKEWIETSLDSPLPPKKQRPKEQTLSLSKLPDDPPTTNHLKNSFIGLPTFPRSNSIAGPESKHYGRIEVENHTSSCYNASSIADANCDSSYYRSSFVSESLLNDDSVSLQNYDYSLPESENASISGFQNDDRNTRTTHRFSSVSDISSLYSEYHDPNICFEKSSSCYPPSYSFYPFSSVGQSNKICTPAPIQTPPPPPPLPMQSHHNVPLADSDAKVIGAYSVHYADSPILDTQLLTKCRPFDSVSNEVHLPEPSHHPSPTLNPIQQRSDSECVSYSKNLEPSLKINTTQEAPIPLSPCSPVNITFASNVEVNVVSVGHFQPYWEETKPYELSDFYKYSTKHRKYVPKQNDDTHITVSPTSQSNNPEHWMNASTSNLSTYSSIALERSSSVECIPKHKQLLINEKVPINEPSKYVAIENNCISETYVKKPTENTLPSNVDSSDNVRASLADTFHEEMLAWYDKQESIKKATLV